MARWVRLLGRDRRAGSSCHRARKDHNSQESWTKSGQWRQEASPWWTNRGWFGKNYGVDVWISSLSVLTASFLLASMAQMSAVGSSPLILLLVFAPFFKNILYVGMNINLNYRLIYFLTVSTVPRVKCPIRHFLEHCFNTFLNIFFLCRSPMPKAHNIM
jgi:hypothetical protein